MAELLIIFSFNSLICAICLLIQMIRENNFQVYLLVLTLTCLLLLLIIVLRLAFQIIRKQIQVTIEKELQYLLLTIIQSVLTFVSNVKQFQTTFLFGVFMLGLIYRKEKFSSLEKKSLHYFKFATNIFILIFLEIILKIHNFESQNLNQYIVFQSFLVCLILNNLWILIQNLRQTSISPKPQFSSTRMIKEEMQENKNNIKQKSLISPRDIRHEVESCKRQQDPLINSPNPLISGQKEIIKKQFKSFVLQSSLMDKENLDHIISYGEEHHIEKKYFFKDLLNQMPYGVCIISQNEERIQYSNLKFLEMLSINKKTQIKDAFSKLVNCYKLFEEQTMFSKLFEMLNNKLLNNQTDPIQISNDPYISSSYESKSESALEELQNILFNISSKIEQKQIVIQNSASIEFQYEVKMFCQPIDQIKGQETKPLYQLMFKPFIRNNKAHILMIVKDVTLFNEISALENINSNKSKMLAQVAHEFRTPLNGIIILTEDRMEISDEIFKKELIIQIKLNLFRYLQPVLSSSKWLLCLVNDILDLAQLNAGKFKLVIKYFDVGQLLIEIVSMMIVQTNFKGIQLDLLIPKNFPQFISSDPNRIKQILINLLSNSIKFTNKGGKITIGAEHSYNQIQFYVCDTGVGIDKEDQGKLFKAFGKIEKTSNLNSQGVGLGLMICNILAIKLSSREQTSPLNEDVEGLKVYSDGKGKGSRFSFTILDHSDLISNQESAQSRILIQSNRSGFSLNSQQQIMQSDNNRCETRGNKIIIKSSLIISGDRKRSNRIKMTQIMKNNQRDVLYRFEVEKSNNAPQVKIEEFNVHPINQSVQMSETSLDDFEQPQNGQISFMNIQSPPLKDKILIVDDVSTNIIPLKRFLERKGFTCQEAFSGLDALETIQQSPDSYKIILMDVEMPMMDGLETAKQIRSRFKSQHYYIIGCSGYSGDKEKQNCLNAGMDDYMEKPVQVQNLFERIQKIIQ